MRTSFELKILAETLDEAKDKATKEVARFLGIQTTEVPEQVSLELKVSYPKAESIPEIEQAVESGIFQITVYGSLKQSVTKPFGF